MLNRRAFLERFGIGVVAACALASLPEAAVRALSVTDAGRLIACEYLRKVYNEWCAAHPGCVPTRMDAGIGLFEAYEAELIINFRFTTMESTGSRNLLFKGVPVYVEGDGWRARVSARRDLSVERARALAS